MTCGEIAGSTVMRRIGGPLYLAVKPAKEASLDSFSLLVAPESADILFAIRGEDAFALVEHNRVAAQRNSTINTPQF